MYHTLCLFIHSSHREFSCQSVSVILDPLGCQPPLHVPLRTGRKLSRRKQEVSVVDSSASLLLLLLLQPFLHPPLLGLSAPKCFFVVCCLVCTVTVSCLSTKTIKESNRTGFPLVYPNPDVSAAHGVVFVQSCAGTPRKLASACFSSPPRVQCARAAGASVGASTRSCIVCICVWK